MNKLFRKSKLSAPSKLVRKALSQPSSTSKDHEENAEYKSNASREPENAGDHESLELELKSLREQVNLLKVSINNMQEDADKCEQALAILVQEKEQLSTQLRKEKRSSTKLKQQLQDERDFYLKEKQQYCHEMNNCQKLKKKINEISNNKKEENHSEELLQYKNRIYKLQATLTQALETNHNLCLKFLRMRNTKMNLKNRLKRHESTHKQAMEHMQVQMNNIKNDIDCVMNKALHSSISPSNKKHLQVIKRNGSLMYENLCLQIEVDRLNFEMEELKFIQAEKESKEKFKCLRTSSTKLHKKSQEDNCNQKLKVNAQTNTTNKSKTKHTKKVRSEETQNSTSTKNKELDESIIKIFERKETTGIPNIVILPQKSEENISKNKPPNEEIPNSSTLTSVHQVSSKTCVKSDIATTISSEIFRTQSMPEISISTFLSKSKR